VGLLEPFCGLQLVNLGSLDGGEYSASSVLAFHVLLYFKLGSPGDYLHTDLLQSSVVVLDVPVGSEGGGNSVLLLHVELLGLVPLSGHLVELVCGLDLERVDTGDGGQLVIGVLRGLVCLLYLVPLVKPVGDLDLENRISGDGSRHVLSRQLRLGVLLNSVLLVNLLLDALGGSEGCVFSILLHNGDLLSHSSLQTHWHANPLKLRVVSFLRLAQ
jgi:hypothetical protein